MNDLVNRVREWYERLAPRERRLLLALGIVVAVFALFLVPLLTTTALHARRDENKALSDAIAQIKAARDDVRLRKARREAILARYVNRAPPLAGLIEKAARDNKLEVPESVDRPEVPHKRYSERTTVVRLRKVTMLALAKMLEQIERERAPIAISRLGIRRRGGEKDSYDVELGVSAFDRVETPASQGTSASPGGGR